MSDEQQQPNAGEAPVTETDITPEVQEAHHLSDPELQGKLGILNNVAVTLTIEVGRTTLKIRDLLSLSKGSIIELNKMAGEPVDIYVNGKMIAQGNIITANGKYCVRLLSISQPDADKV